MPNRRRFLATAAGAGIAATSGCLGFILGEEAKTFAATEATVTDATVDETGYESEGTTEQTVEQEFSAAGESRTVAVNNYVTEYQRSVGLAGVEQRAAVFAAFTTPQVELLGETFNPIADLSTADLAGRVQSQYEGFSVGEQVGTLTVDALGASRDLATFEGTATLAGAGVDVYLHVGKFTHGEDFVVPFAVYPQRLPGEEEDATAMARGLRH